MVEKNYPLFPNQVTVIANRKVWWKCKDCGNEWYTLISTRSGGSKCPYCSGLILLKGFNDFATTHPQLSEEWSDRNLSLTPDMSMQSPGEMYGGNVGDRETVLDSNEKDTDGAKYMCGFTERNELFERCSDCMVSNDYAGKERKMNCRSDSPKNIDSV